MQQEIHEIKSAKNLLISILGTYNVNEFQVPAFIDWYENHRDKRFLVVRDTEAYNLAKAIRGLNFAIESLEKSSA